MNFGNSEHLQASWRSMPSYLYWVARNTIAMAGSTDLQILGIVDYFN